MELRELFDPGSDTRVSYVGALGAAGVAADVLAGVDGNVFLWTSLGDVVGLVAACSSRRTAGTATAIGSGDRDCDGRSPGPPRSRLLPVRLPRMGAVDRSARWWPHHSRKTYSPSRASCPP